MSEEKGIDITGKKVKSIIIYSSPRWTGSQKLQYANPGHWIPFPIWEHGQYSFLIPGMPHLLKTLFLLPGWKFLCFQNYRQLMLVFEPPISNDHIIYVHRNVKNSAVTQACTLNCYCRYHSKAETPSSSYRHFHWHVGTLNPVCNPRSTSWHICSTSQSVFSFSASPSAAIQQIHQSTYLIQKTCFCSQRHEQSTQGCRRIGHRPSLAILVQHRHLVEPSPELCSYNAV